MRLAVGARETYPKTGWGALRFDRGEMGMKQHPRHFKVDEVWILFQLTSKPIITKRDGAIVYVALLDAASCKILSFTATPAATPVAKKHVEELLKKGWEHHKGYPSKLCVTQELLNSELEAEAQRRGLPIVGVPERQLGVFIDEAKRAIAEAIWPQTETSGS